MVEQNLKSLYSKYKESDELSQEKIYEVLKHLSEGHEMFVMGQTTRTELVYGKPQETIRIRPVKQPTGSDYAVFIEPEDLTLRLRFEDSGTKYIEVMGENKDYTLYVNELMAGAVPFKEVSEYLGNLCHGTGCEFNINQTYGGIIKLNEGQQINLSQLVEHIEDEGNN